MITAPYRIMVRLRHFLTIVSIVFVVLCLLNLGNYQNGKDKGDFAALNNMYSREYKLLCYVLINREKLEAARQIKATWGSKCDMFMFFGRFEEEELPVTFLDAKEGYKNLWGKTQRALMYLADNLREFDWYLKADDDTFVIVDNLRNFLRELDPEKAVWSGYLLKHKKFPSGYMSGGAGYVFSKAALTNVTELFSSIEFGTVKRAGGPELYQCDSGSQRGMEDMELGKCFREAGVENINSIDPSGRERFLPVPLDMLWENKVPTYHWIRSQAWNPLKMGRECCSPQLISTHQIAPNQMKQMYDLLYKKNRTRLNLQ